MPTPQARRPDVPPTSDPPRHRLQTHVRPASAAARRRALVRAAVAAMAPSHRQGRVPRPRLHITAVVSLTTPAAAMPPAAYHG
uniref:Uncharacterized protein n=1 Tax=Setaria italica TaxID=4555 RepID=K3ZYM0_SETIT